MSAIKYQSLKDHVYHYIAQKIQDGTLLPNEKINEAEICKTLDISRTPTREALFQLASDNLLEYIPRRGFTVKNFNLKTKQDVSLIIGVMDALAASLALELLSDSDLDRMEHIVSEIDEDIEKRDFSTYYKKQYDFHQIYISRCDNPTLIEMIDSLKNSFIRHSYLSENKEELYKVLQEVNKEHRQIIDLFRKKDKEQLDQVLKYHWRIINSEMI